MSTRLLFLCLAVLLAAAPAARAQVQATLVAADRSIQPGHALTVALRLVHQPGWHTYSINPGDSGYPTALKWDLPAGWTAGPIQWPPAKVIRDAEGTVIGNGYEGTVLLPVTLTPPADLKVGTSDKLDAVASWLMCQNVCVPGKAALTLTLPVIATTPLPDPVNAPAIAATVAATVNATAPPTPTPTSPTVSAPATAGPKIDVSGSDSTPSAPDSAPPPTFNPQPSTLNLSATTLGLAFLGGLILNLMPCVFPVLGIKILGFVKQAGADRRKVTAHGLAFAGGVLLSFWALAGALALLRAGGSHIGWGFQLQSPGFVFALAAVMLVFALSLSGVFEFGLRATAVGAGLQRQHGYAGSFFTGVLATVVATPCSAPFLAPALGAALALPVAQSFVVFTAIAAGLALPYLLLSIFPGAVRLLPRPGAWMETFKQAMAFPLYASVGYLVWVLAGQTSGQAPLFVMLGLTVIAMGAWWYGRCNAPGAKTARARLGLLGGLGLLAAGAWLGWPQPPAPAAITWEPWSTERVAQLRAEGRPVYVDFSARWCFTCQTNKKIVFSSPEVLRQFHDKGVVALLADWTNDDPLITAELAKWGRSAVPFNLLYLPGLADPKVLPEVLTPGDVLKALDSP